MASEGAEGGAATPAAPGPSKAPLILGLLNSLAVLGVLGVGIYTRILYQRPKITEDGERERLAAIAASPPPASVPGLVVFDAFTVNIQPYPAKPRAADGTPQQIQGKMHYVQLALALEVADEAKKDEVEGIRPLIMDRMISLLGHKEYSELTTVQGRYLLREQILSTANQIAKTPLVTNVYFTQFLVQ